MKILFVSHVPEHYILQREPLGIMALSASLKKAGHEVQLCSPRLRDTEQMLDVFPAEIVAYSVTTGFHNFYLEFNDALRKRNRNLLSVFGGPHTTFSPDFIEQSYFIDAICRGEGDYALVDFVERFAAGIDYHLTPNFYVRRNGRIYKNPVRNLVDELDTLPFLDRELLYDSYPMARENRLKFFITMRGCPYRCTYCFNHRYNEVYRDKGKILRRMSVDNAIGEVLQVKAKYPLELIYFHDDTFPLCPDWIEEFSHKYKERVNIPFVCNVRLDLITEKVAADLKRANCVSAVVAIESGNDYIRNQVLKRSMSRNQILTGTKILRSCGIRMLSENILAIPGSVLENDLETYTLNKECSVFYILSHILQPFPGTEIYEYAKKLNLLRRDAQDIQAENWDRGESLLKLPHRKQQERLSRIMAICGALRLPTWLVKALVYLPLKPLYSVVCVIFKGYCGTKLFPYKTTLKQKMHNFFQLFTLHYVFGDKWKVGKSPG